MAEERSAALLKSVLWKVFSSISSVTYTVDATVNNVTTRIRYWNSKISNSECIEVEDLGTVDLRLFEAVNELCDIVDRHCKTEELYKSEIVNASAQQTEG